MNRVKMWLDCARLAQYIDKGDDDAFGELVSDITGCNDAEWYIDHVGNIVYFLSETLEYAGARLCIRGSDREIYIDTYNKSVSTGKGENLISVDYTQDKLGIDEYCRERYEESK